MSEDPSFCHRILIRNDAIAVAARHAEAYFAIAPCDPDEVSMKNDVAAMFCNFADLSLPARD